MSHWTEKKARAERQQRGMRTAGVYIMGGAGPVRDLTGPRTRSDPDRARQNPSLVRHFGVGDYTVAVSPASRLWTDGTLRWHVEWQPHRPDRMTGDLIREFERGRAEAIRQVLEAAPWLLSRLEANPVPSRAVLSTTGAST